MEKTMKISSLQEGEGGCVCFWLRDKGGLWAACLAWQSCWVWVLTLPSPVQSPWSPHSSQLPRVSVSHLFTVCGGAPWSEFELVLQEGCV